MMADAPMLNYLYWLRQRGQVLPRARRGEERPAITRRSIRFLVVTDRDAAELNESQYTLIERMLAATGLPRQDFIFETMDTAAATLANAEVESVLCLGKTALATLSARPFDHALTDLIPIPGRETMLCTIHTVEDMEGDPNLKRATWQQLQRLIAAVKKEPRA